jgi:hypothetical protein
MPIPRPEDSADCGVSLRVIQKRQEWGGPGPRWAVAPEENKININMKKKTWRICQLRPLRHKFGRPIAISLRQDMWFFSSASQCTSQNPYVLTINDQFTFFVLWFRRQVIFHLQSILKLTQVCIVSTQAHMRMPITVCSLRRLLSYTLGSWLRIPRETWLHTSVVSFSVCVVLCQHVSCCQPILHKINPTNRLRNTIHKSRRRKAQDWADT